MSSTPNEIINEDTMILSMVEIYCRCEGERSQRHLEGSRINWAMRGEREREREEEGGGKGWGAKRVPGNLETKRLA